MVVAMTTYDALALNRQLGSRHIRQHQRALYLLLHVVIRRLH